MLDRPTQGAPLDRYVVLEYLAEGGMGAIYLGKKMGAGGFEREVVLKQLLPEFTRQPEFIDLFLREARLSATLDHANIVHTIDLVTAGEEYFMVMEYVPGADLRTLLKRAKRRRHTFSPAAGLYIASEILAALRYAHAKTAPGGKPLRLIHRDISPSNILCSSNGEVKLTDFGIAKASTHNSVFYRVKGKVGYMSPEQARSEPLDSRSDLYSVAVCLYELLTGERLFVHAGLTTSSADIYKQPIPIVSRKVSGLPPAFDKLMLKALALDPRARFQTAGEFQEALLRAAHRSGLIMSAPQLSRHLREICGAPDNWRRIDGSDAGAMPGEGTELYDVGGGTEQIAVSSLDDSGGDLIEIVDEPTRARARRPSRPASRPASRVAESARRRERQATSITNISRLQGLELTSMINLAAGEHTGAHPLVDLSDFGGPNPIITSGTISTEPPATDLDAMDAEALPIEDDHSTDSIPEHDTPAPTERVQMPEEPARAGGPRRPAVVVSVIVLLGIGVAVAIALSGPRVNANDVERRDLPRGTAVAPAAPQPATTATPDATP